MHRIVARVTLRRVSRVVQPQGEQTSGLRDRLAIFMRYSWKMRAAGLLKADRGGSCFGDAGAMGVIDTLLIGRVIPLGVPMI